MSAPAIPLQHRTIFTGDNLPILRALPDACVDLIYLDPPFNTRKEQRTDDFAYEDQWNMHDLDVLEYGQFAEREPQLNHLAEAAYYAQDSHTKAYCIMMALRLRELHRLLKPTGSIYLHCDPKASHYLKAMLDIIFGMENFRNEIIWKYNKWTNAAGYFQRNHDVIFMYGKTDRVVFNKLYHMTDYKAAALKKGYTTAAGPAGRRVIIYDRARAKDKIAKAPDEGREVVYADDKPEGVATPDVWTDINYLSSSSKERTGYPTQKPLKLLERIITASSNDGDMVLDPFCGCATACVAAERLGRKWVGIDQVKDAYDLMVNRLVSRGEGGDQANLLFGKPGVEPTKLIRNLDAGGKVIPRRRIKTMEEIKRDQERIKKSRKRESVRTHKSRGDNKDLLQLPLQERLNEMLRGKRGPDFPQYRESIMKNLLYGFQHGHCAGCKALVRYDWIEMDHIHPKVNKGADDISNRILLCPGCNKLKGTGTMDDLMRKLKDRNRG